MNINAIAYTEPKGQSLGMVYAIAESNIQKEVSKILSWCFGGRGTPVLIPNTEVKPPTAEGTAQAEDQVGANLKHLITEQRSR